MICKPGELILIPFPYSDLSAKKKRPVLALTGEDKHGDFIALAITSVKTAENVIHIESNILDHGSLPKPSWIRTDKIFTLSSENLLKSFGKLNQQGMQKVLDQLCEFVGHN